MRVSIQALAPLPALLFFASCVTPPPMPGPGRTAGYREAPRSQQGYDSGAYREREYQPPAYEEPSYESRPQPLASANPGSSSRWPQDDPRRFDDGRYNLRLDGQAGTVPASYEAQQGNYDSGGYSPQRGYDDRYVDPVPPHERGNYTPRSNGRISFLMGGRDLDDENFLASDELFTFGVEFSQPVEPGTLGFEFGFLLASDEDENVALPPSANFGGGVFDVERDMAEVYAGLRTEFGDSSVRPYIGGGGVLMNMTERRGQGFLEAEQDDSTVGAYLHGGVQIDLNEIIFLGIDFRRVFGSQVELFDRDLDTDYSQLSFVLGLSL